MKPIRVSRRQILGGLLLSPVASLTGCGSSGNPNAVTTAPGNIFTGASTPTVPGSAVPADQLVSNSGEVKPVLVYYQYADETVDVVEKNLNFIPDNVVTTPDRFAQGALCYEFNGSTSKVIANDITDFPKADFAILFWAKSSATSQMEAVRIIGSDTAVVIVGVNGGGVLTVTWNGTVVATMSITTGARLFTDGFWHHITVQRYSNSLQLFVDGVACGAFQVSQALPVNPTMQIGGGEAGGWNGAIDDMRLYNRAFPAASIPQAVYQWTQVKAISATDNLAEYYPFNGNALNDLGHGVDGVPFNVTPTADRFGTADAAYLFNGIDSYIALNQPLSSTAAEFAVGFWERSSTASVMTAISASSGGAAGSTLDIVFNSGAAVSIALNGAPLTSLSTGTVGALTDNNWHFIVLQRSGSSLQLYVDGALTGSAEDESIFFGQSSVVQFGRGSGAGAAVDNYWNGALDDIQIYEAALTAQQVVAAQGLQFRPRDGAGALTFQDRMWLLGGWNPGDLPTTNNQVWSSADGINWTLATRAAAWEERHDAGYAVLNNRMWIVGGDKNTGHYQNDVWSSADGVTWDLATSTVPWANRATQYVLAFDNKLWLMGGQMIFETAGPVIAYNDVYSSSDGVSWQLETSNAAWSRRGIIMGNVAFQGRMWVIGGGQYDVRTFNNDVWSSADGVEWTQVLANAPWTPRQFHNITVFDNKIWVLAGGDNDAQGGLNDVWYSTDGAHWTQLEGTPWIPRHAASVFVLNNFLWLACGSDSETYNDVWKMGYAP